MSTRALWLGRSLIGIPDDARVVYPSHARGVAIVGIPRLDLYIVTEHGQVQVPAEQHDAMLNDFFDGARAG